MNLWKDRRLRLSITRLGAEYLAALLLVGGFAVNTGNNLLYLIFSLMLGLFLVSGIASRQALRGLRLLSLDEGNLFARVRGGIRLRMEDRAPRRVRGLEVHLELEDGQVEPGFYAGGPRHLGEGRKDRRRNAREEANPVVVLHARAPQRGWNRIRSVELRTRYPFGFLEKAWRFEVDKEVLVLPHPRTPGAKPANREGEGHRAHPKPGQSSPEGARPHRPGDPPGRVHWKRTAQRSQPWVRTFEDEVPHGVHLRLDLRRWVPGRDFERELERLSGSILQARLQNKDVSLEVEDEEGLHRERGYAPCWRALALAVPAGTLPPGAAADRGGPATGEVQVRPPLATGGRASQDALPPERSA